MPPTSPTAALPSATPPARANVAIASILLGVHAFALLIAPALAVPRWLQACALVAAALLSPMLWALVHEAIHGLLFRSPRANRAVGRLLSIAFGAPFRALRFAHLRHHRYSRTPWGREEVYDPAEQPRWAAYLFHYFRITLGLYVAEWAVVFACWLPAGFLRARLAGHSPDLPDGSAGMQRMFDRDVLGPAPLREIRIDSLAVLALFGSSFAVLGPHWPWLLAVLGVRALIASQLDHAPHHGTPLERREYALNMHAPAPIRLFLLNFPLHRVHHAYPHLPWTALPRVTNAASGADIGMGTAVLRQWRGPIALDAARALVASEPTRT